MLKRKNYAKSLLLSAAIAIVLAPVNFTFAQPGGDCDTRDCRKDLARARAATAKYHDFSQAIADGFLPGFPPTCIALPDGGVLGVFRVRFDRVDFTLNIEEPEVLLYLPDDNGNMRLIAVEYVVPYAGQAPPALFGREMELTSAGPFVHYQLVAWLWHNNPDGMFTTFNQSLRCPQS